MDGGPGCSVVLLVASLRPFPFERRSECEGTGPAKLLHFAGHGCHAYLLAAAFEEGRMGSRASVVLGDRVSTGHGVVTGRLRERVPGRAFEPADVVAGFVGSAVGAMPWLRTATRFDNR